MQRTSFSPSSLNCSARRCSAGAAGVIGMAHTDMIKARTATDVIARITAGDSSGAMIDLDFGSILQRRPWMYERLSSRKQTRMA